MADPKLIEEARAALRLFSVEDWAEHFGEFKRIKSENARMEAVLRTLGSSATLPRQVCSWGKNSRAC